MKKLMCVLLALALVCLSAALAETIEPDQELIDRFEDVWVDGDAAVEIWYDDGTFHCSAVLGDEDESSVWEYETCAYDAEHDALIFEGGERYSQTYLDDDLISELAGQDLTAVFSFNEDGRLLWDDSEGICTDFAMQRLFDAEEAEYWEAAEAFMGAWQCDRATIEISPEEDDVKVLIYWGGSAWETAEWVYTCQYDEYENTLTSVGEGTLTYVTYGEDGELISAEEQYSDGAAIFSFDENGCVLWDDLKEHRGDGMAFEPIDFEDDDPAARFEGRWATGRCTIEIAPEEDAYAVFISWGNSAADSIEWNYICLYDDELDALISVGEATKADVFYGQDGEITDTELFYNDGVATFTIDADGCLLWNDEVDNAGEDMAFEYVTALN